MAVVTGTRAISLDARGLMEFNIINQVHDSRPVSNGYYAITKGEIELSFYSPENNFTYAGDTPTGGTVSSIVWDSTGALEHGIFGISVGILTFLHWIETGQFLTALNTMLRGPDTITGSNFADNLVGFGGNDRITGGLGADRLTGGPGRDTFVFRHGFGRDVIRDFSAGPAVGDVMEMHGMFTSLAQVRAHSHINADDHLVIVLDAADTITLSTLHSKGALATNDFHFLP